MHEQAIVRAVAAARSIVASHGLVVDDTVVLSNSNKLMLRLLPCDLVARVAPADQQNARFEIDLARRLLAAGCPVGALDPRVEPRVHERDDFVVTLWTHYEQAGSPVPSAEYAAALARLHAGMRTLDDVVPDFLDRVGSAQRLVASHDLTPALPDEDRELLEHTLGELRERIVARGSVEQLLHGEPHPGNLLAASGGPVFIDLETTCRGPVEFDLAHAPDEVAEHYPDVDQDLLRDCRLLMLAMIIAWRWDPADQFPDGHRRAAEWQAQLRTALG